MEEALIRPRRRLSRIVLMALTLALPPWAWATQVLPLTVPEMVKRSAQVVHGTVQKSHTAWEAGGALLYTYVTLDIQESLKGPGGEGTTLVFRQLGGRDGDQIVFVPGTPRFHPKQEVLIFLTADDAGGYPQVMGIFQGAFRPSNGPGASRRVAGMSPETISSLRPNPAPSASGGAAANSPLFSGGSFQQFLAEIRALVEEQAREPQP